MTSEQSDLTSALMRPAAYPEAPDAVEFLQTHISLVFLAGENVYKIKKAVDFGFLDFSTLELRRASCLEEVRLNRRLSPDIYLGVVPITAAATGLAIGGDGEAVDWAVWMRRLPADQMLEMLVAEHKVPEGAAARLGEIVGQFHLGAARGSEIARIGGFATIEANWRQNFEQTTPFQGRTLSVEQDSQIRAYVTDFLERERALLDERDAGGFIRDLHGDLRSAQIWMLEHIPPRPSSLTPAEQELLDRLGGVRILDCIEFNERLRFCDTASDIGFLAMDLVFRMAPSLARELMGRYLEVTGDSRLPLLLNFYCCYRAYVRGKVDLLALEQRGGDAAQRRRLTRRARRFFRLAARYATGTPKPRLVITMGVSGSGKSFLARLLAVELGAVHLSSDLTRKRLLGVPPTSDAGPAAYSAEQTERTYAALLSEAEAEIRRGHPVVLDATFLLAGRRAQAAELARDLGVPFTLIWCHASPDVLAARLSSRQSDSYRVSDAGAPVAASQAESLQPPNELKDAVIRVDTGRPIDRVLGSIRRKLG